MSSKIYTIDNQKHKDSERNVVKQFEEESVKETFVQVMTSCRWIMAYTYFLGMIILYFLRVNMGLAMVCMVKASNSSSSPNVYTNKTSLITDTCSAQVSSNSSAPQITGNIEWDKNTQGWVLSSFFYGYIVTQMPGGYLAGRFGGKCVFLIAMIVYGAATLLIPVAARYGGNNYQASAYLVIALRVICGLATGVVFPALQYLVGRWAPKFERTKLMAFILSGTTVGTVVMLGLGGFFCQWTSFDGGWPSIFYLGGGICLLYCVLWALVIYDSPYEHPRITKLEKQHLMKYIDSTTASKNKVVPWLAIIKSPAVWAIIVCHTCNNFGTYTLLTKLPAFMKEVLKFDIVSNGLYSALPYIAMFLMTTMSSVIFDKLRKKSIISTALARKLALLIALLIPAACLVATGYIKCEKAYLAVILLTLALGFNGFNQSGYAVNVQDIAQKYAGEIYGISNTFATIPGMVSPVLVNMMTPKGTQEEWQRVFFVWAGIFCFGALFFAIFARGEEQDWAKPKIIETHTSCLELVRENSVVKHF